MLHYQRGTPLAWANLCAVKLINLPKEIMQQGRSVAVKNFSDKHYWLEFKCGELMNVAIDPESGQSSPVSNPTRRECPQQ